MKKILLCIALALSTAYAQIELESVNLLELFRDFLEGACAILGDDILQNIPLGDEIPEELTWMCATLPAIHRATEIAEGFLTDVNGFTTQTMSDSFAALGDALGWQIGDTDIQGLITDAVNNLQDGVFSAKGLAGQVMSEVNQALYERLANPDEGTGEGETAVATQLTYTPSFVIQEMQGVSVREDNLLRTAQAVDIVSQSKALAATAVARGDEEQLLLRVTNPAHAFGGEGGTADDAEDLGFAAVSSRAALQAQVQATADYMRQDAVSTTNIVAALKEQAMQQSLTTQQLGVLIQSISEENLRNYEQWEAEYYDQVVQVMARGQEIEEQFTSLALLMSDAP